MRAANDVPNAQASPDTYPVLMPMRPATERLLTTARNATPILVHRNIAPRPRAATTATINTPRSSFATAAPPGRWKATPAGNSDGTLSVAPFQINCAIPRNSTNKPTVAMTEMICG